MLPPQAVQAISPRTPPPITTTELDAFRVATIRHQLLKKTLNAQAVEDLLAAKLAPTGTNLSYRKNQLRFLEWAIKNGASFTSFTPVELVNFLSDIRTRYNLQVSTLKTVRAAVAHLHNEPTGIRKSELINSYIDTMLKQAPPVPIHRPTIDISPRVDLYPFHCFSHDYFYQVIATEVSLSTCYDGFPPTF
ncbi:Nuclear aminoacylation-dependent tRNA export pathway component [Mucor velutinosus]|uniref:Nuclear aminoacylation-dependent tRNA export pathway component n=1 Tax=Mucor velutinosus TaxID=708070 RepID=A0AAN7DCH0_9FUNG|nr:Nuclear aminoacylation-dependent tRNA export pathway component [Mucor velutinosus]